jgi:peptidoglycan/xylan/chitin deacetylase (PgdA/CDA1 family)
MNMREPAWMGTAATVAGLHRWRPQPGPLIVMYHGVGGPDGISVKALEQQLIALRARRRIAPLAEVVRSLERPEATGLAAITFDDGYRDFAELAVPVLRELGLHATLFVPAAWVGKTNGWDAGRAPERQILTGGELRELDSDVVDIGAHGFTHRRMRGLDARSLHAETAVARDILQDVCGRSVSLFAFPYGQLDDFDSNAEHAVRDAGFHAACSTHFGRGSLITDRFRMKRVGILCRDSVAVAERKFDGPYDWLGWKQTVGARLRGWRESRENREWLAS